MIRELIVKIHSAPWKWCFYLIAAAGLLLRLEYLREFSGEVYFPFAIGPDVQEYHERALEIVNGNFFPAVPEIHAPLYSFFLAFWYKFCGISIGVVRCIQLILNFAALVALAELVRRISGKWKFAAVFLALGVFTPVLFFHQAELISESLLLPLVTGFFWQIYSARERKIAFFGAGMILGLTVLTHGLMNFFLAGEVIYYLIKKKYHQALLIFCGALAVILPVISAKSLYYGKFTPIQSNSIYNLWIGNNPDATGGCYLRPGDDWETPLLSFRQEASARGVSENRILLEKICRFYLDEPEQILLMPLKKTALLLSPKEAVSGADEEYLIRKSAVQRIGAGMMAVLIVFSVIGAFFAVKKKESAYIHFYLLTIALAAGMILTVAAGRYRQGMMAGVILLAALGAVNLGRRAWVIILLLAGSGMVIIPALAGGIERNVESASIIGEAHYRKKEFAEAEKFLQIARRSNHPARYHNMLGAIAEERGDLDKAQGCYRAAMTEAPAHHDGFLNCGHLLFYHFPQERSEALKLINAALERNPALPSAYDMLGQDFAQRGDYAGALKNFELALKCEPGNELYQKKVKLCRQLAAKGSLKNAP